MERTATKLPRARVWTAVLAGLALVVATLVGIAAGNPVPAYPAWTALTAYAIPLLLIGGLIRARRPDEPLGKLLLAQGVAAAVMLATGEYATFSALGHRGLPFTGGAAWVSSVIQSALVVSLVLLVLAFPTGRLVSRRWRIVGWAVIVVMLLGMGTAAFGGPMFNSNIDYIRNPLAIHPNAALKALVGVGTEVFVPFSIVGVLAHLVVRYRRSTGEEREQLKWFLSASVAAPIIIFVPTFFFQNVMNGFFGNVAWTIGPLGVILAVGVAILRYRLYDIDVVINRTLVYGLLAAFITAVYVAIVVGIGAAVGQGARPNLGLSILATAVVAVAFQPVRQRVQRLANRLVYGKRATPYEVLSAFSERVSAGVAGDETLAKVAQMLGDATAASTTVWLATDGSLEPAVTWPEDGRPSRPVPVGSDPDPLPIEATLALPVRHQGALLGAISLVKRPGERLAPAEEQLARDLAAQAGLVLHNVRLVAELRARLAELQSSRAKLVAAQDRARKRLERNIHDGAQQQLVALSVKANLARQLAAKNPAKADELLRSLRSDLDRTLADLSELTRGMVPAALSELGLVDALRAQASRAALPVVIDAADDLGELPVDVQAAVYFSVLEALQNVAKYASASRAVVRVRARDDGHVFEVEDDGRGFDTSTTSYGTGMRGMAERLTGVGGALDVRSVLGAGTTVTGRIPSAARSDSPASPTGDREPIGVAR
jgi:signal transduction histidine kinase